MRKVFKKAIIFFCIAAALLLAVQVVYAQTPLTSDYAFGGDTGQNAESLAAQAGLGTSDPREVIARVINITLGFLGIIAVIIIIYAGFLWMTAAGNTDRIDKAKKIMTGGVIGLIIILASFGIATFILRVLLGATGGGGGPTCNNNNTREAGEQCDGIDKSACTGGTPYCVACRCSATPFAMPQYFQVVNIKPPEGVPSPDSMPRNTRIAIYFNLPVNPASVTDADIGNSGIKIKQGGKILISSDVNYEVKGSLIILTSTGSCPANSCGADKCFDPADYTVEVKAGSVETSANIDSKGVQGYTPSPPGFTIIDTIDCQDPAINLTSGTQVCLDTDNEINPHASDDSAVSDVAYSDNHDSSAFVPPNPNSSDPYGAVWHPSESLGYLAQTPYTITGLVNDVVGNINSSGITKTLRAAHCCNTAQDEDEIGTDCGGADCAACVNTACGLETNPGQCSNNICASDFCSAAGSAPADCEAAGYPAGTTNCCLCKNAPVIDWITPAGGFCDGKQDRFCLDDSDCDDQTPKTCNIATPNGAAGNLITIGGRWFGAPQLNDPNKPTSGINPNSIGKVYFGCGGSADPRCVEIGGQWMVEAEMASAANSQCDDTWTDERIIVAVPEAAVNGPIKVVNGSAYGGFSDMSNDGRGTYNQEFLINNIGRPGICAINPPKGQYESLVTLQGIKFGANRGAGDNILFGGTISPSIATWNNKTISGIAVPNIAPGKTTVAAANNGILSNVIDFEAERSDRAPFITKIEPAVGHPGDYVTIYGGNFGAAKLPSTHVYFGNNTNEANYNFPAECSASVWQDTQIVVKVPEIADNDYKINIKVDAAGAVLEVDDTARPAFRARNYCENNISVKCEFDEYDSSQPTKVVCKRTCGANKPGCVSYDYGRCVTAAVPGLCKIDPDNGPANTEVNFYGERFGDTTGSVNFYNNKTAAIPADTAAKQYWLINADPDSNAADLAAANVPVDAQSGPVKVLNSARFTSNGMLFSVGSCLNDYRMPIEGFCGANICCPATTMKAGSCLGSFDQCGAILGSQYAQYYVEFSTASSGEIACDGNILTPACDASDNLCPAATPWCNTDTCVCEAPRRPEVVVECNRQENQCAEENLPSPSPLTEKWDIERSKPLACTNAVITARFTQVMDLNTLTAANINIYSCSGNSSTTCPSIPAANSPAIAGTVGKGYADNNHTYFSFTPNSGQLEPDKWYEVALKANSGIKASSTQLDLLGGDAYSGHNEIDDYYIWHFKTRDNSNPCNIGCVTTVPKDFIARRQNQQINYQALPDSEDNACVMINAADYNWRWTSDKTDQATIFYNTANPYTSTSTAAALEETAVNNPVIISAQETTRLKTGTSTLNISFNFNVEEVWPVSGCENVCRNAAVGARFSNAVAGNSLLTSGSSNFKLYECGGALTSPSGCTEVSGVTLSPAVVPNTQDREVSLNITKTGGVYLFEPKKVYRVALFGGYSGIRSAEGSRIDNGNTNNGNYEWQFATGESICQITRIDVQPNPGVVTLVGDYAGYRAIPYSADQLCLQDREQRLTDKNYNWTWAPLESANNPVAFIPPTDKSIVTHNVFNLAGYIETYQSAGQESEARGEGDVITHDKYGQSQVTDVTAKVEAGQSIFDQTATIEGKAGFILQCGYTNDNQCHTISGTTVNDKYGVGENSCCYPRPWVESSLPVDNSSNVCRNSLLSVQFNEEMDITSFNSNIIVAAKYDAGAACPEGTEYLLVYNNSQFANKFTKIVRTVYNGLTEWSNNAVFTPLRWAVNKLAALPKLSWVLKPSLTPIAWAENLGEKWCVVNGRIGGYNQFENGIRKGVATFAPTELLPSSSAGREHIILIKGDEDITDSDHRESVRNSYGVSLVLPEGTAAGTVCRGNPNGTANNEDNECIINTQPFYGHIIKFKTWADHGKNNNYGVCLGDHIMMEPPMWMFNTRDNDTRDDVTGPMYDSLWDSDKEFAATMMSTDGQELTSVAGYGWEWSWQSNDNTIIDLRGGSTATANNTDPSKDTAMVDPETATRARTSIDAIATINENSLVGASAPKGNTVAGTAEIRVFLCDNPWPPYVSGEPWPFVDQSVPCPAGGSGCYDTNFEFFYCRDSGVQGTAEDLPAISDNGAIRGYSEDIIKEFLFTRADRPTAPTAQFSGLHDRIQVNSTSADLKYRLYCGTSPGNYSETRNMSSGNGGTIEFLLDTLDLVDGATYYFAAKAINSDGAESDFSNEVNHEVAPVLNPPTSLRANLFSGAKSIVLKWNKSVKRNNSTNKDEVDPEVSGYKIYMESVAQGGTFDGIVNQEQRDAGDVDIYNWTVSDINRAYYFKVAAMRDGEEAKSDYIRIDFNTIGWWEIKNGGGSGMTIADKSHFAITGSVSDPAGWDVNAEVFNFNGARYMSIPQSGTATHLNLHNSGGFTESVWINPDLTQIVDSNSYAIMGFQEDKPGAQNRYPSLYIMNKNEIHAGFGTGVKWCYFTTDSNLITNDDYWYFIAVVYDKQEYKLYVNGELKGSFIPHDTGAPAIDCVNEIPKSVSRFDIGKVDASYFSGNIADVKIYNHIRTAEQIADDYNNSRSRYVNISLSSFSVSDAGLGKVRVEWSITGADKGQIESIDVLRQKDIEAFAVISSSLPNYYFYHIDGGISANGTYEYKVQVNLYNGQSKALNIPAGIKNKATASGCGGAPGMCTIAVP